MNISVLVAREQKLVLFEDFRQHYQVNSLENLILQWSMHLRMQDLRYPLKYKIMVCFLYTLFILFKLFINV